MFCWYANNVIILHITCPNGVNTIMLKNLEKNNVYFVSLCLKQIKNLKYLSRQCNLIREEGLFLKFIGQATNKYN